MSKKAFTLIELLIVVAIIAILAAIAVPNFLEAQVRSKISRVKSDHRTVATAVEAYQVDNNRPPYGYLEWNSKNSRDWVWSHFTTPIAYLTSVPRDPFTDKAGRLNPNGSSQVINFYEYDTVTTLLLPGGTDRGLNWRTAKARGLTWYIFSLGPSRRFGTYRNPNTIAWVLGMLGRIQELNGSCGWPSGFYDPSNGTTSYGRIMRSNQGQEPV